MRVDCFIAQSIQSIPDTQSPLVPLAFVENFVETSEIPHSGASRFLQMSRLGYKAKIKRNF